MSTTVIVTFRARPGRMVELAAFLRELHAELPSHAGFESISLLRDESAGDRLVEIERWAEAAAHRCMVEAVDARDGWQPLDDLVEEEPVTVYLGLTLSGCCEDEQNPLKNGGTFNRPHPDRDGGLSVPLPRGGALAAVRHVA